LFHDVARHCRCVVAMRGYGESSHGGSYRTMPVIGLPSDLDYMYLMFTQLMVEMIRRIDPQVQPGESLAEAVYRLRFAGLGWERLTQRVWDAGLAKPLRGEHYTTRTYGGEREVITAETPFVKLPTDYWQRVKKNLAVLNRKHVAEHGLPRNYTKPEVYQRSFAEGFVREIARRLRAMREQREHRQTNGMELALVEVRQQAVNLYREVWPEPEPVEVKSSKRRSRAVVKELAFDLNAYGDGARAGAEVDLSNKTSSRVSGGRGSLPSGS
jgi:hypothetical protein